MADLIEVVRFYDPEEAFCANSYLQSAGIRSFIQNEYHLTAAPMLRIALGGYPILCPASQADQAASELRSAVGTILEENEILELTCCPISGPFKAGIFHL